MQGLESCGLQVLPQHWQLATSTAQGQPLWHNPHGLAAARDSFVGCLLPCCDASLLQVFVDTTGWAFAYPLAKLAGCRVACYTHYPTVSTNMLGRVWSQQAMYNNDDSIRGSTVKSLIKVLYYQLFALVYGLAGGCAGAWSHGHGGQFGRRSMWDGEVRRTVGNIVQW